MQKDKPTRLIDIAREANVSRTTIAQVLLESGGNTRTSKELQIRVKAIAKRLNYRPNALARQLKGKPSRLIGVLIGADNAQVNFDRLREVERHGFRQGYNLVVGQLHEDNWSKAASQYLNDFEGRGLDTLVCLDQGDHLVGGVTLLRRFKNAIFLDAPVDHEVATVRVDYGAGIKLAIHHLVETGRRRIAIALHTLGKDHLGSPMRSRLKGFEEAKAKLGLSQDPSLIWSSESSPMPTQENIEDAVQQLIVSSGADAILCNNDHWAVQMLKALKRRRIKVPEQVALVGFDNLNISTASDPELTTIDQQHDLFAKYVMEYITQIGEAGPFFERIIIPQLVLRETT